MRRSFHSGGYPFPRFFPLSHFPGACMSLSKKIAAKLKTDGLTAAQAAKQAGITAITFKAVLAGKSVPNSRSVDKYAKFLGMSTDEVLAIAGSRKGKGKAAKAKKPGKRGRPPGKSKRGRPAGKAKRGRPPGKASKAAKVPGRRGRPAKPGVPLAKVKAVAKQIARAQKVLDRLAGTVAKLG